MKKSKGTVNKTVKIEMTCIRCDWKGITDPTKRCPDCDGFLVKLNHLMTILK